MFYEKSLRIFFFVEIFVEKAVGTKKAGRGRHFRVTGFYSFFIFFLFFEFVESFVRETIQKNQKKIFFEGGGNEGSSGEKCEGI